MWKKKQKIFLLWYAIHIYFWNFLMGRIFVITEKYKHFSLFHYITNFFNSYQFSFENKMSMSISKFSTKKYVVSILKAQHITTKVKIVDHTAITTKQTHHFIAHGDQINYCADVRTANLSSIDDKLACSVHAIDVCHQ